MIIQTFWKDAKGAMAPGAIIGLMIALIFLAYLMPVGLDALAGVNDTAWTTAATTLLWFGWSVRCYRRCVEDRR